VNWFGLHLYWGRGNNLESILLISPVADLITLYLSFRMQECRPPSPQDAGMIVLSMGMGYSLICLRSTDLTLPFSRFVILFPFFLSSEYIFSLLPKSSHS
jgi:hypothetical protein